jgi:hypothetical protein
LKLKRDEAPKRFAEGL